jgi:3-oxoacyl-[acyl-carrier protein] reductase
VIAGFGRKASFVNADVTKVDECRRLVTEAHAAFGRIDILVNNAGYSTHQQFEKIEEQDFDLMLNLHLKGLFFIIQAAIVVMTGGGRIINISSEQAYIGHRTLPHYSAAKAGMLTMTRSLAMALAPAITVNCVAPGPTATARFKSGPEFTDEIRGLIPLKRWVEPRDVARSVVFLASSDGDAYTGQILDPNGGTVMP